MFCPKCGASAGDSSRFCPKCGAALSASGTAASGTKAPESRLRMSGAPTPAKKAPEPVLKEPVPVSRDPMPEAPLTDAGKHVKKAEKKKDPVQTGSGIWLSVILMAAILLAAVGTIGVCSSAMSRTSPDEKVLEDENAGLTTLVAEGNAAYSLEDYELALDFYLLAAERFPQEPDVLCRLADAYYELEDDSNALKYYQMAVMLYGEDGTMPVLSAQNFYNLTEE